MKGPRVFDPESTALAGMMLLEASAGTGKTYALERMVARLIGREKNPLEIEGILVVTFTNRAAREMKERIRSLLAARSKDADRSSGERERYRKAISSFHRAPIFTIHGFCQMVLSSWPFESSSPFSQELVPGGVLESAAVRTWMSGLDREEIHRDLMRSAYRQAGGLEGLISNISGKITRDDIPPGALVLPTGSESADFSDYVDSSNLPGSKLESRAEVLFSVDWSDRSFLEIFAAHTGKKKTGASLDKIRSHMLACRGIRGLPALAEAMFGDPSETGVKTHFLELMRSGLSIHDGLNPDAEILRGEARELAEALAGLFHEMEPYIECSEQTGKPVISLVKFYMQCAYYDIARKEVEERIENLKDRTGHWGYSDLIRRVALKVSEPESPLLPVLRRRFGAALIDEFQDTDPRQWTLFRTIFGDPGTGHLLALIGDPKQSIYGFRGTGLQAYNEAKHTVFPEQIFRLDTNYRSSPGLVAAANRFFSPLFNRTSTGGSPVGFEDVASGRSVKDVLEWPGSDVPVTLMDVDSREDSAISIVSLIRILLDPVRGGHWKRENGRREHVSASNIAVLVRGRHEEEDILSRLAGAGIPAVRIRSRSVFGQDLIRACRGLLDAFENPRDTRFWRSVLLDEFFSLPGVLLMRFQDDGRLDELVEKGEHWHRLFLAGRSTEAFEDFFRFSVRIGKWTRDAGFPELGEFLGHTWPERVLCEPDGMRQWQDWNHLCELIQARQAEGVREISLIKDWMAENAGKIDPEGSVEAIRLETEAPAVRVMTMHTSKGLEFPLVFLHGGYSGRSSRKQEGDYRFDENGTLVVDRIRRESNRNRHLAHEWEEDKRLWYVAFTRASVKLWLPLPGDGDFTQVESLMNEVLGGEDMGLPPHQVLTKKEAGEFRTNLRTRLGVLTRERPRLFSIAERSALKLRPLEIPGPEEPSVSSLPSGRLSDRDPVTSSYTSLIRSASGDPDPVSEEKDDKDVDGQGGEMTPMLPAGGDKEPLPLSSDRGAMFGTLVHELLEQCDFQKVRDLSPDLLYSDVQVEELFSSLARRYYPSEWYPPRSGALKKLIWNTLRADIPGLGRLCDLEDAAMRAEVEFNMSVPGKADLRAGNLRATLFEGFLKGFIDLLLKSDGRWWVVDWKTNVPPLLESAEAYDGLTITGMMDHHQYHLQYELYLLALCRTLSGNLKRPVDWENEIGGAAYLFVRAARENDSRGIYVAKPPIERMLSLSSAMNLNEVLK